MNTEQFVAELSKLRPGSTFLTLKGYRNASSEVADYSIIFHMSYKNALERSITTLEAVVPVTDLEATAKQELIDGYSQSLKRIEDKEEIDDAYTRFFDSDGTPIKGVKLHTESETLHLYGLVVHKKVIMPGNYKKVNKKELTIAKDKLRKLCPVEKFRQFKILPDQVDKITVDKLSLLPPE